MTTLNRRSIGIAVVAVAMSFFLAIGGATSTQAQTVGPALFADVDAAPPRHRDEVPLANDRFWKVEPAAATRDHVVDPVLEAAFVLVRVATDNHVDAILFSQRYQIGAQ